MLASGRFELIEHDIVTPFGSRIPRFDQIYNLACPASPPHYQADPVNTALICSHGTYNCLQAAKRNGARFFQASTSEIYGDPDVHPQPEKYHGNVNPVGPRSCYDEGKRFAETLVTDFGQRHGVATRIARIFNTYGPRMQPDDGRVVSNFIVQALLGRDITIYGSGEQTRSFCFVSDLVDGFVRLMAAGVDVLAPVNLGNPAEITVGELARIIVDIVGSRSKVVYRPLPMDDPRRRRPDIERAQSALGWSPKVELLTGLRETIAYFDDQLRRNDAPSDRRFSERIPAGSAQRAEILAREFVMKLMIVGSGYVGLVAGHACQNLATKSFASIGMLRRSRACERVSYRSSSPGSMSWFCATPPQDGSPSQATSPN